MISESHVWHLLRLPPKAGTARLTTVLTIGGDNWRCCVCGRTVARSSIRYRWPHEVPQSRRKDARQVHIVKTEKYRTVDDRRIGRNNARRCEIECAKMAANCPTAALSRALGSHQQSPAQRWTQAHSDRKVHDTASHPDHEPRELMLAAPHLRSGRCHAPVLRESH